MGAFKVLLNCLKDCTVRLVPAYAVVDIGVMIHTFSTVRRLVCSSIGSVLVREHIIASSSLLPHSIQFRYILYLSFSSLALVQPAFPWA